MFYKNIEVYVYIIYIDATELISHSVSGKKKLLGPDHSDSQESMMQLALHLKEQGRIKTK